MGLIYFAFLITICLIPATTSRTIKGGPLKKGKAVGLCFLLWFVGYVIFGLLKINSPSSMNVILVPIAFFSYLILVRESEVKTGQDVEVNSEQDEQ